MYLSKILLSELHAEVFVASRGRKCRCIEVHHFLSMQHSPDASLLLVKHVTKICSDHCMAETWGSCELAVAKMERVIRHCAQSLLERVAHSY